LLQQWQNSLFLSPLLNIAVDPEAAALQRVREALLP
jgi:hypothetical protein